MTTPPGRGSVWATVAPGEQQTAQFKGAAKKLPMVRRMLGDQTMRTVTLLGPVFALGCAGTSNGGVGVGGASSSSAGSPDTATVAAASGAPAGAVGGAGGTSSGAGGRPQCPQATMSCRRVGTAIFQGNVALSNRSRRCVAHPVGVDQPRAISTAHAAPISDCSASAATLTRRTQRRVSATPAKPVRVAGAGGRALTGFLHKESSHEQTKRFS
jgi:hypothetical protein